MITVECYNFFSFWSFPYKVSVYIPILTCIFSWNRIEFCKYFFVSAEYTIFIWWISTPVSPDDDMSSCIECIEEVSEVCCVCMIYWTSKLIPCFSFESWYVFTEFLVKIFLYRGFVYSISCLLTLASIYKSDEFLVRISPYPSCFIIWFVIEWQGCYNLIFCSFVPKRPIYCPHSCYLTREWVLLECQIVL